MMMIDFNQFSLTKALNNHSFNRIKFVSEVNSQHHGVQCKQLDFLMELYGLGVRILILEQDSGIEMQVHFENVCKNIDIKDTQMEQIIDEMSQIAWRVEQELLNEQPVVEKLTLTRSKIHLDPVLFKKHLHNNEQDIIDQVIHTIDSRALRVYDEGHYPYTLILFGSLGLHVAEALKAADIADYTRQNSGYRIKFYSNEFQGNEAPIVPLAKKLSELGISASAVPLEIYSYFW